MKLSAFSIRDSVAQIFGSPFFVPTVGVASRTFTDSICKQGSQHYDHFADYELWFIGNFSEETGAFEPVDPQLILRGDVARGSRSESE